MMEKIRQIWKVKDLRLSIAFVLAMLLIFRLAAHVPIPGVDALALKEFFAGNQVLGLMSLLTGGGMENFSIVMLGVGPYITSSIIFQLLAMIIPAMEEMNKEEAGRQKVMMWSRWATVPISMVQSYGMITLIQNSSGGIIGGFSWMDKLAAMITITAGTILLMWLGELISEKKIGNGISFLIFAGIVAGLPTAIQNLAATYDPTMLPTIIAYVVVAILTVVGVVIINEGQRNIPVQYARQIHGNRAFGGASSHLPIRVNMAGVMPIIFAVSIVMFPQMAAQFFQNAKSVWLSHAAQWFLAALANQWVYGIMYFILVFGFTYFYTEVIFHPKQIAENLQKQGGFIPGIRPGRHTSDYLYATSNKVIFTGALSLAILAIMPIIVTGVSGIPSMTIGGTSILIVVSVVIETVKQIEAQLSMREYDM
ncbi:preprotein translocase subunit SecY [Candidatus Falkowbacteria bacterium CG10_big_fil_rev_8_21_14_0_10_37_14]|uniref:Protein translocase subunit SecY n=1 Tax=Candidatus Falkowbacteria bacterium CG10_big_fil_rev_8_21_14_0_10_37_14 TaxID=1974561 RepID=A0A2M6WTW0_9BACT|nr:preprotein translocase subunit SecY [Candidatus Falkowbacteria bacterium]PIT96229.1 MAG: preprotein translocase subunit SecY [Candidatus Falkowbacteria bacterium CG10_big_fil_rev_8_21_14_0_10_37_14]